MAIWQFRLDMIPEAALRAKYGIVPIAIPEALAENFRWWTDVQPPARFEEKIDAILPRASSWSESMRIWGEERGDTAAVCYDDKCRVEWLGFRVDVGNLSHAFVKDICRLAKELKCVLLTREYHLIAPDELTVFAAINRSTAKSYLNDPVSTLRGLKHTVGKVVQFSEEQDEKGVPPSNDK